MRLEEADERRHFNIVIIVILLEITLLKDT